MLALFLPGIFLLGFNIGTGSVTAMAKAGATYGMSLLWTIVASCLATFFMINVYGRFTLVTGETALQAFRQHIHPLVGLFFICCAILQRKPKHILEELFGVYSGGLRHLKDSVFKKNQLVLGFVCILLALILNIFSRSMAAAVVMASLKICSHLLNGKLLVSITLPRSYRSAKSVNSTSIFSRFC